MLQAIKTFKVGMKPHHLLSLVRLTFKGTWRDEGQSQVIQEELFYKWCSLLTDSWWDQKQRNLIYIVAHCPTWMAFLHSQVQTKSTMRLIYTSLKFVDEVIQDAREENVVHIVTYNASNNMWAANLLSLKRPSIFGMCCVAWRNWCSQTIASSNPSDVLSSWQGLSVFIYNHMITLSMMREITGDSEGWCY